MRKMPVRPARSSLDSTTRSRYVGRMRVAFKEWAVVVDALGRGEQILILRKGGLREGSDGFQIERPQFLLFPTRFHQQREAVRPAAQARFDRMAPGFPAEDRVRLEYVAEIIAWQRLDSLAVAQRLCGQHILRDEVVAERFEWGRQQNIFAIAVRVFRLPVAVDLPMLPQYGGCKSWIDLETDVDTSAAAPVMNDQDFSSRLKNFEEALAL